MGNLFFLHLSSLASERVNTINMSGDRDKLPVETIDCWFYCLLAHASSHYVNYTENISVKTVLKVKNVGSSTVPPFIAAKTLLTKVEV